MKFKKFLIIFLVLIFGLSSCNKKESDSTSVIVQYYDIEWKVDDTVIRKDNIKTGRIPVYKGDIPVKEPTAQYTYVFDGWEPTPTEVTGEATYTAKFKEILNSCTITFETNGGTSVGSIKKEYGEVLTELPHTSKKGLHFVGWTLDKENKIPVVLPYTINDNLTFYAHYNDDLTNNDHLATLLMDHEVDPNVFIKEPLKKENHIINDETKYNLDLSKNINISKIDENGYLNEWKGVLENLELGNMVKDSLKTLDYISDTSITEFNDYLETKPEDVNNFKSTIDNYNYYIKIIDNLLTYTVEFKDANNVNNQIYLSIDTTTNEKVGRIELDNNIIKFKESENEYLLLIHSIDNLDSYTHLTKDEKGIITGEINEIRNSINKSFKLTINEENTIVIGDSSTRICEEIYDNKTGKLVFYIDQDLLLNVNNIYFNLNDITSFKTIRKPLLSNYYINDIEIKSSFLSSTYAISNVNRFYNIYETVELDTVLKTKSYKTPMFQVNSVKYDTLKADFEKAYPTLKFELNVDDALVKEKRDAFNNEINLLNEISNKYTKEKILKLIGEKNIVA